MPQVAATLHRRQLFANFLSNLLEGVITKAPLGGEATGPSPVDRAKKGTNRRVLTDRRGAPVAVVVTGANTPDKTVALETVESRSRPLVPVNSVRQQTRHFVGVGGRLLILAD
jgi:hypothetical protein